MARVPWHLFKARQPRAHLLVAAMEADCLVGPDLQAAQSVLQRFVRKQKPSSDYATTVVRETGRPEVYLAFEDEDDAGKVAAAVEAQPTVSYLGWASQRVFQLDEAKVAALAASLPAPKTHPRRTPPTDHGYWVAFDAGQRPQSCATIDRRVPARNASPRSTVERAVPKERTAHCVIKLRDAKGE